MCTECEQEEATRIIDSKTLKDLIEASKDPKKQTLKQLQDELKKLIEGEE